MLKQNISLQVLEQVKAKQQHTNAAGRALSFSFTSHRVSPRSAMRLVRGLGSGVV